MQVFDLFSFRAIIQSPRGLNTATDNGYSNAVPRAGPTKTISERRTNMPGILGS